MKPNKICSVWDCVAYIFVVEPIFIGGIGGSPPKINKLPVVEEAGDFSTNPNYLNPLLSAGRMSVLLHMYS